MAEIKEILVQWPATVRKGVCPRGAQVLLTEGTRRKPDSSRKARWAPSFLAFFYMGPPISLPMSNRGFIPFASPCLRLLTAPAFTSEKPPEVIGMVGDSKPFPDHVRHPASRPKIRGIAV